MLSHVLNKNHKKIICTINFLCVSNLHNTRTRIDRQSSENMSTYFVSMTANQIAVYANVQLLRCDNYVTNRKIPYFKQFIRV